MSATKRKPKNKVFYEAPQHLLLEPNEELEELAITLLQVMKKSNLYDKRDLMITMATENPDLYTYVYSVLTDGERNYILDNV
jgi:hypothetical protein